MTSSIDFPLMLGVARCKDSQPRDTAIKFALTYAPLDGAADNVHFFPDVSSARSSTMQGPLAAMHTCAVCGARNILHEPAWLLANSVEFARYVPTKGSKALAMCAFYCQLHRIDIHALLHQRMQTTLETLNSVGRRRGETTTTARPPALFDGARVRLTHAALCTAMSWVRKDSSSVFTTCIREHRYTGAYRPHRAGVVRLGTAYCTAPHCGVDMPTAAVATARVDWPVSGENDGVVRFYFTYCPGSTTCFDGVVFALERGIAAQIGRAADLRGLQCAGCDTRGAGTLALCAGCHAVRFCSEACQRRAWPTHKAACRRAAAAEIE